MNDTMTARCPKCRNSLAIEYDRYGARSVCVCGFSRESGGGDANLEELLRAEAGLRRRGHGARHMDGKL